MNLFVETRIINDIWTIKYIGTPLNLPFKITSSHYVCDDFGNVVEFRDLSSAATICRLLNSLS
jgi:hypothetical protein